MSSLNGSPRLATPAKPALRGGGRGLTRAIDFDLLRQELSDYLVEGPQERFRLDWPGKRRALLAANAPIAKTLRPVREESVDFDTTRNLFIEGDNLDALKLLQESYLGKVKLIYIDPPYNTGHDFVYNDDFAETAAEYLERSGQVDESGARLVANTESNGRFHSDWLSMMYPRLKLARNLLAEDGVILISIDDTEVANLREICDEIFGRANLVTQIVHKARASVSNDKIMSQNHNHILLYARDFYTVFLRRSCIGMAPNLDGFSNPDCDPRGAWRPVPVDGPGGAKKGNPHYEFMGVTGFWRFSKKTMQTKYADGLIIKTTSGLQQKYFLTQAESSRRTITSWWDDAGLTSNATRALSALMGEAIFDNPKPVELMLRMLELFTFKQSDAIVLDFFAGSSSTAHAVIQSNAEDGGSRRFIMVQLNEQTHIGSDARKNGYVTISDLSKERIRRAGTQIKAEVESTRQNLDVGFRALKVDTTNMADVRRTPDDTTQGQLDLATDSVKPGRSAEDLLFQVMLDWGLELTMPISQQTISEKSVWIVEDNALVACFEPKITPDVVRHMAGLKPLRAVFLDSGFDTDADRINAEQVFREVSPETDVKAI